MTINWEDVVVRHKDFVKANKNGGRGDELSVCLRDGWGTFCAYGPNAWIEAAEFLGFKVLSFDGRRTR